MSSSDVTSQTPQDLVGDVVSTEAGADTLDAVPAASGALLILTMVLGFHLVKHRCHLHSFTPRMQLASYTESRNPTTNFNLTLFHVSQKGHPKTFLSSSS